MNFHILLYFSKELKKQDKNRNNNWQGNSKLRIKNIQKSKSPNRRNSRLRLWALS